MSIFDKLAENRYQQWIEDQNKPGYTPADPVSRSANRTSFEAQLYRQMLSVLDKAATAPIRSDNRNSSTRHALLAKAHELHIQLTVSLEKKNLPLAAATLTRSFRQRVAALDSRMTIHETPDYFRKAGPNRTLFL